MGTLKVDPTKTPKEIDATDSEGKTILGIYKFDKDQFTVCFAPPDKQRPKEFSVKVGSTLSVPMNVSPPNMAADYFERAHERVAAE